MARPERGAPTTERSNLLIEARPFLAAEAPLLVFFIFKLIHTYASIEAEVEHSVTVTGLICEGRNSLTDLRLIHVYHSHKKI